MLTALAWLCIWAAGFIATAAAGPVTTTTFSSPGSKSVTLKVCNAAGCSTVTRNLTVLDPAPRLLSVAIPSLLGTADPPFTFSATAAGRPPLFFSWTLTLPDGSLRTSTSPSFSWSPTLVGSHSLTLSVSNLNGTKTTSAQFSVIPTVFADVPPNDWAAEFIEALFFSGLTTGCGLDAAQRRLFCPTRPLTRAEAAVFVERALHPAPFSPPAPTGRTFGDVPAGYWAADWIELAFREGLTTGCAVLQGSRLFCPNDLVTRAEIAVFLERALHPLAFLPPPAVGLFADVPASYWAAPWIEQLYRDGVTTGCSASGVLHFFCPAATTTRAEMAALLARAFRIEQAPTPTDFLAHLCSGTQCSYAVGLPIDFALHLRGGIPLSYDFDWDGNGTYEESVVYPVSHTYLSPGVYRPRLRVRRGTWSAVLSHPYPLTLFAPAGLLAPPASISASADSLVSPSPSDPPGTPTKVSYQILTPSQPGVLGYAAFVSSGGPYVFAGLLQANRATAADRLLLPPSPGVVRFLSLKPFTALSLGTSSLPIRLP